MNLKKQLMTYKEMTQVSPKEENIQEAIKKSKETFYIFEQESLLSYHEFLWAQFRLIQKRWWIFQLLLLLVLGAILLFECENRFVQRSMGVIGSLFVILIIPELWKNKSCQCMEIEASSYYSLRQIYAARMLLFGIVDTLLITVFCQVAAWGLDFKFTELLIQFLFPMSVTACICFTTLCSKHSLNEAAAIVLCIIWSTVWLLIVLNEKVYSIITLPIWLILLALAIFYLSFAVYKTINSCDKYWEVTFDGIEIK